MLTSDNKCYNEWQRVTTYDSKWQRVAKNDNEWQRMTASDITNENEKSISTTEWF